jgi:hypothetical protein
MVYNLGNVHYFCTKINLGFVKEMGFVFFLIDYKYGSTANLVDKNNFRGSKKSAG